MIITSVTVKVVENTERGLHAICSLVLDEMLAVHDIKVVRKERDFLAMPSTFTPAGVYRDIVHPIKSQARQKFEELLLALYGIAVQNDSTYQRFTCVNTARASLLEQEAEDFEPLEG